MKKHLTTFDRTVISLICIEMTPKEIATVTGKSVRSIEEIRLRLIKKIGCTNNVGVVKYAIAHKITPVPKQRDFK